MKKTKKSSSAAVVVENGTAKQSNKVRSASLPHVFKTTITIQMQAISVRTIMHPIQEGEKSTDKKAKTGGLVAARVAQASRTGIWRGAK